MFLALQPDGIIYQGDLNYRVRQYALFGDGSYKITDQWKFEAGLRWYRYQSRVGQLGYRVLLIADGRAGTDIQDFRQRL